MNGYRLRLVLNRVENVSARDLAAEYDRDEFSTRPVEFPTGHVTGRVIGPDGTALARVQVVAASTEEVPQYMQHFSAWTDRKGRFSFAVPPGRYVIGLNTHTPSSARAPFAPTYYPNASRREEAKQITVSGGQRLKNVNLLPSQKLRERVVPVRVVWPDGRPVVRANVWLTEVKHPYAVVGGGAVSHTDSDGSFDLRGFEGIDYVIHANIYTPPGHTPHCALKRPLTALENLESRITMVLKQTGEGCLREQ